jgi:hypothetical protein
MIGDFDPELYARGQARCRRQPVPFVEDPEPVVVMSEPTDITPMGRFHRVYAFSEDRVLELYKDQSVGTYLYSLLGISGGTITVLEQGNAPTSAGVEITHDCAEISANKMLLVFKGSTATRAQASVVTLAGDSISFGTAVDLEAADTYRSGYTSRGLVLGRLEPGKFVVVGQSKSTSTIVGQIVTVDGSDVITPEALDVTAIAGTSQHLIAVLSPTAFILVLTESSVIRSVSVTGTTLDFTSNINLDTVKPFNPPWSALNITTSGSLDIKRVPGAGVARVAGVFRLQDGVDDVFREGWFDITAGLAIDRVFEYDVGKVSGMSSQYRLAPVNIDLDVMQYSESLSGTRQIYRGLRTTVYGRAAHVGVDALDSNLKVDLNLLRLTDSRFLYRYNTQNTGGTLLTNRNIILELT